MRISVADRLAKGLGTRVEYNGRPYDAGDVLWADPDAGRLFVVTRGPHGKGTTTLFGRVRVLRIDGTEVEA